MARRTGARSNSGPPTQPSCAQPARVLVSHGWTFERFWLGCTVLLRLLPCSKVQGRSAARGRRRRRHRSGCTAHPSPNSVRACTRLYWPRRGEATHKQQLHTVHGAGRVRVVSDRTRMLLANRAAGVSRVPISRQGTETHRASRDNPRQEQRGSLANLHLAGGEVFHDHAHDLQLRQRSVDHRIVVTAENIRQICQNIAKYAPNMVKFP